MKPGARILALPPARHPPAPDQAAGTEVPRERGSTGDITTRGRAPLLSLRVRNQPTEEHMKPIQTRRGFFLLAAAGVYCLAAGLTTQAAPIPIGSGPDRSYFVIESPNIGTRTYEIRYTHNPASPRDGAFLLNQIISADSSLSFQIFGSTNIFVNAITTNGVTESGASAPPWVPYWAHWSAGGAAGFPAATPIDRFSWSSGSGLSSPYRAIAPGSWDALVFSDGSTPPATLPPGPYPPGPGSPGSDAVPASDPRIVNWAATATVVRGPVDINFPAGARASFGSAADATGPSTATAEDPFDVVSLGDGGSATLTFDPPFGDIPGPDFAVFENGFSGGFLELAHVEVSSDGVRFFRFPSVSLTPTDRQVDSFEAIDPTRIHNLAGKHPAGFGTPFDLAELRHHAPALDIERITHVRVIDVVGSIHPAHASHDSEGRVINDPYPTPFHSGGFDLDAVGVFSRTATGYPAWAEAAGLAGEAAAPTAASGPRSIQNGIAFATAGDLEIGPAAGGGVIARFSRRAYRTGASLRLESSADLGSWSTVAASVSGAASQPAQPGVAISESGAHLVTVSVTLPPDHPGRFFRLAVDVTVP